MPWETRTREEMRGEFMREFTEEGANRAEVCRSYGMSRKTGYKWLKRYKEGWGLRVKGEVTCAVDEEGKA